MKKMRIYLFVAFMLAAIVIQQSCKKDNGDAPTIPPQETFVMNFSDLDSSKAPSKYNDSKVDSGYTNFLYSAGNVWVWNVIITVGMAVPVASFCNAFNYTAEWDKKEKVWVWEYDFTALLATYSAKLTGEVDGSLIHWKMYISKENGFQNFLWYSGDSYIDGTQGTWTLYDNAISNTELLGIIWHKNVSAGTYDIKYTNIVPSGAENGGYIYYGVTADTTYNAFYDIYNKGQDQLTNIKWNRTYYNGSVKDSIHFGNNSWRCWGTDFKNDICQ